MSRRFGRNQKRRMRQEIAEAGAKAERFEQAYAMSNGLASDLSNRLRQAEDRISFIRDLIGKDNIAMEPRTIAIDHAYDATFRLPILPPFRFDAFADGMSAAKVYSETMNLLMVESNADALRRDLHLRVDLGNKVSVRYAISDSALHDTPPHRLHELLTRQLTDALVPIIKKQYGSKA